MTPSTDTSTRPGRASRMTPTRPKSWATSSGPSAPAIGPTRNGRPQPHRRRHHRRPGRRRAGGSGDDRPPSVVTDGPRRRRRLYRIRQGQWFAGVCTGLAAYGEFGVDWVRTIFILLSVATAGLFALVYLVMALVLPVVATREAWIAEMDAEAVPERPVLRRERRRLARDQPERRSGRFRRDDRSDDPRAVPVVLRVVGGIPRRRRAAGSGTSKVTSASARPPGSGPGRR